MKTLKPRLLYEKSVCEGKLKNVENELELLKEAENMLSENSEEKSLILIGLGNHHLGKKEYEEARKFLLQGVSLFSPRNYELQFQSFLSLHVTYGELNRTKKAALSLQKAEEYLKNNFSKFKSLHGVYFFALESRLNIYKGGDFRQKGKFEESIEYYKLGYEKFPKYDNPDHANLLLQMGNCYIDMKNYGEAKNCLKRAIKMSVNDDMTKGYIFMSLMIVYAHLNKTTSGSSSNCYKQASVNFQGNDEMISRLKKSMENLKINLNMDPKIKKK